MKNTLALYSGLTLLALLSPASAAELGWAVVPGDPYSGGTGTWSDGGPNWNSGTPVNWNNAGNDTAQFEGTAGTVTVAGGVSGLNMIFKNIGGYVLTGDTITLSGGFFAIEGQNFTGTNTINNNINLTAGGDSQFKVYDDSTGGTLILNGEVSFTTGSTHTLYVHGETAGDAVIFNGALGNDTSSGDTIIGFGRDGNANNNATYQMNAASSGFGSSDFVTVGRGNLLVGNGAALGGARVQLGDGIVGASDTSSLRTSNATTISSRIELVGGNSSATYRIGTTATGTTTFSGEINLYDGRSLTVESAAGSVVDLSNQLTNDGGLIKNGTGTAILSRASGNSFTGTTTVNAGTLLVNNTSGSGLGGGPVVVNSGATFGGSGRILNSSGPGAAVTVVSGGVLLAGNGETAMSSFNIEGYLTVNSGAHIALVLGPGLDSSQLIKGNGAAGLWTLSDTITFDLTLLSGVTTGTYEDVLDIPGLTPTMTNWTISNPGVTGSFFFDGGHVDLIITAVPEPSTVMLLSLGLGALLFRRRKGIARCS